MPTPRILSQKGFVDKDLVFGLDPKLAHLINMSNLNETNEHAHHGHEHDRGSHQNEVEVLSVTLDTPNEAFADVDISKLDGLLREVPKDEIYRIKAILFSSSAPTSSNGEKATGPADGKVSRYVLNWAFGRWAFYAAPQVATPAPGLPTPADSGKSTPARNGTAAPVVRMTIITAQDEAMKWKKRIERDGLIALAGDQEGRLLIEKVG